MIEYDNLEEYGDPENYDREDKSDTGVAFYAALAQETGGQLLEIACGTGRVTIPIARLGFAVTGLDIVPGMLDQAKRKAADLPICWIEADARAFELGERFQLIFLTGNAFQAFLTRSDQEALLRCVQAHLHDEGLFAFETRNPRWKGLVRPDKNESTAFVPGDGLFAYLETREEETYWRSYRDVNGRTVRVTIRQRYDPLAQILHWTNCRRWVEEGGEQTKITRIAVRYTFPQELEALLHYNGFSIKRQYGDWDLSPLTGTSPSIISVCRKRA